MRCLDRLELFIEYSIGAYSIWCLPLPSLKGFHLAHSMSGGLLVIKHHQTSTWTFKGVSCLEIPDGSVGASSQVTPT